MAQSSSRQDRRRSKQGLATESVELAATQAKPRAPAPAAGFVVAGKYAVEGLLGQGGMGAVYSATHVLSGKRVAIKWMLPAGGASAELAERFVREARATARINHPNVVDIHDVGVQDGSMYLVMELLEGESLAQRLDQGPLPQTDAVALLMPALRAVATAHAQGVIHRDLKPDNIFLCRGPEGEPGELKVLDFGISKIAAGQDLRDFSLTQSGTVMGTPLYMSPEQVRGLRDVDERGDVYAFGVILYEMLTAAFPFDAETYNELILKIVTEEPTPLETLAPEVDPGVVAVVRRAMARNRGDRFPSIAELALALEPYAGGVTFRRASSLPGGLVPAYSQPVPRGTAPRTMPLPAAVVATPVPANDLRPTHPSAVTAGARGARAATGMSVALALAAAAWWWVSARPDAAAPRAVDVAGVLEAPREANAPDATPVQATRAPAAIDPAPAAAPAPSAPPQPAGAERPVAASAAPAAEAPGERQARAPRRRARRDAAEGAPAPSALPADWDERLDPGPAAPRAPTPNAARPAGELSADDL